MLDNPLEAWQELSEHYRGMCDEELRELAADFADLTEVAQQALRDEMKNRGMALPQAVSGEPMTANRIPAPYRESLENQSGSEDAEDEGDPPHDYTWKTLLCACDTQQKAWQISEALRRAGVESWIGGPNASSQFDGSSPCVLVAADQLDQAREIAARPIAQEIIDESSQDIPEYKPPVCPKCGAEEPVLEGVDPVNTWHCESCGHEWTDPAEDLKAEK